MLPIAQAYQALKVSLCVVCLDCVKILMLAALGCKSFVLVLQDKVTKEVNFILANQETIQSQITELEAAIKQMEVNCLFSVLYITCFVKVQVQQYCYADALLVCSGLIELIHSLTLCCSPHNCSLLFFCITF